MAQLSTILGFEKTKLWWYRDLALAIIGAIAALWAFVLLPPQSVFDLKLAVGAVVVSIGSIVVSPNRLAVAGAVIGIVAIQGWFAAASTNAGPAWVIAITATLLEILWFVRYRRRSMRER